MNKSVVHDQSLNCERTFWRRTPCAQLRPLVNAFMARREYAELGPMLIFPNAQPEIFAHFADPYATSLGTEVPLAPLPPISVLTPRAAPYFHRCGPRVDWFLMQLTPLGCLRLLGTPMAALKGADLNLAAIIGPEAASLLEALARAPNFERRCEVAESWALTRSSPDESASSRLSAVVTRSRTTPIGSVRQVAVDLDVSERRLRQMFAAQVGISPKSFFSIVRAERVWTNAYLQGVHSSLFDEFADQSHAAREFKRFTGTSLGKYLGAKAGGDTLVNGIVSP